MRVEDFEPLSTLIRAYELQPGKHYIVICDGKHFSYELAHALFAGLRENHPELEIQVIATTVPKGIQIGEKKEPRDESPSTENS